MARQRYTGEVGVKALSLCIGALLGVSLLCGSHAYSDQTPVHTTYQFTEVFNRVAQYSSPQTPVRDYFGISIANPPPPFLIAMNFFVAGASKASDRGSFGVYASTTGARMWDSGLASALGDALGFSTSFVGDSNRDGTVDVAAGAPQDLSTNVGTGYVQLRSGINGALLHTFYGATLGDTFGWAVGRGPDINDDGVAEIVVGAPQKRGSGVGYIKIFNGVAPFNPIFSAYEGTATTGHLGNSIVVGNFSGGFGLDIAVGMPGADTNRGKVLVWTYAVLKAAYSSSQTQFPQPTYELVPSGSTLPAGAKFGVSLGVVSSAGQSYRASESLARDAFVPQSLTTLTNDKLLVGATGYIATGEALPRGAVYVYGSNGSGAPLTETARFFGTSSPGSFGDSLTGIRDVNGDGVPEVAVGNTNASNGSFYSVGKVTIHDGVSNATLHTLQPASPASNQRFGFSLASFGNSGLLVGVPFLAGTGVAGRVSSYTLTTVASGQSTSPIGAHTVSPFSNQNNGGGSADTPQSLEPGCFYGITVILEDKVKRFISESYSSGCNASFHDLNRLLENHPLYTKASDRDHLCVQVGEDARPQMMAEECSKLWKKEEVFDTLPTNEADQVKDWGDAK